MSDKIKIEIEKNIPIPTINGRGGVEYPYRKMEVGDSFLIPRYDSSTKSYPQIWRQRTGFKFRYRKEGNGTRYWRVA